MIGSPDDEPRTTLDWLAFHAGRTPGRIAVIDGGKTVDYGQFHSDAVRFCHALAGLGVAAGKVVAVLHPDTYIHWLLVIACDALAATSTSVAADEGRSASFCQALERTADLILTEVLLAGVAPGRQHILDGPWLRQTFSLSAKAMASRCPAADGRASSRMIWTSGTTAAPKGMLLRRAAEDWRIGHVTRMSGFTADSTFLILYSLALNAVLTRAEACLRLGARVAIPSSPATTWTMGGSHLWCLPAALDGLLRRPPPAGSGPLRITTGGAPVAADLRRDARRLLGAEILVGYGANEVGSALCLMDENGIGTCAPETELAIVDDDGVEVSKGADGIVALRSPGMVDGYLDDDDATGRAFRNGWFLTGDLGRRCPDGRFLLHGRRDDMLNFGGIKLAPATIEDAIRQSIGGVAEVAAVTLADGQGRDTLHLALVLHPGSDIHTVNTAVAAALPAWIGPCHIGHLTQLPKTSAGKVRRAAVRAIFQQLRIGGTTAPPPPHTNSR